MIKLNLAVLARSEMDLGFRGRLKMSLDLRGQVWKRVLENNLFWSETGSGFGEPGSSPLPKTPRNTPPGSPHKSTNIIIGKNIQNLVSLDMDQNFLQTLHSKVVAFFIICMAGWQLLPQRHRNVCKFDFFSKGKINHLIFKELFSYLLQLPNGTVTYNQFINLKIFLFRAKMTKIYNLLPPTLPFFSLKDYM